MIDYQFRPLGKVCAGSGKPLVPGSPCISALVQKGDRWERLDFAHEAWTGPPAGTIGYWNCSVPVPSVEARRALTLDQIFRVFEQMVENANPAQDQLTYVLALLLMQKRKLHLDGSQSEGKQKTLRFAGAHGEGPYEIRDQQLSPQEIERLQQELTHQLFTGPDPGLAA